MHWQRVMTGLPLTMLLVALFGLRTDTVRAAAAAAVQMQGIPRCGALFRVQNRLAVDTHGHS
jgi:hypothetical protein